MTMSWHFLMNLFSAFTMVCRNFRYCTCRPWVSVQWTKCWTTRSLISLHNWKLFMKMCCMVTASRIWERRKEEERTSTKSVNFRFVILKHSIYRNLTTSIVDVPRSNTEMPMVLTPGLRNKLICLWRRAWFCWFPAQKFCRNSWASFMISCIRTSSPWCR